MSGTAREHDFDSKQRTDEFNFGFLVFTNETFYFQMADEDLAEEDHFDKCD